MNDLEIAEKQIRNLEDQKENILGRTKALYHQRQSVSHAAYTGNAKAKATLDKLNSETSTLDLELENINSAIRHANSLLDAAKGEEARAADKANALALRDKLKKFRELGETLDDCFVDFKTAAAEQKKVLDDIHKLGCSTPNAQQYRVLCEVALKSAVQTTAFWSNDFPAMAPNQRKSFQSIVDDWCNVIEANIAARLNEREAA